MGYKFRGAILFKQSMHQQHKKENIRKNNSRGKLRTRSCVYQAFLMAFVGHYNAFSVRSHALLCVPGHSCVFPCVLYASELASVGNYSYLLWPRIGLCYIFTNPVRSQCYSLESTLVGS